MDNEGDTGTFTAHFSQEQRRRNSLTAIDRRRGEYMMACAQWDVVQQAEGMNCPQQTNRTEGKPGHKPTLPRPMDFQHRHRAVHARKVSSASGAATEHHNKQPLPTPHHPQKSGGRG